MFDELIKNMIFDNIIAEADNNLCFTAVNANSTVKLTKNGSPTVSGLQYKVGNGDYFPYIIDTVIICKNAGDKVYFRNTKNTLSSSSSNSVVFTTTGLFDVSGDLSSLINNSVSLSTGVFYKLFQYANIRMANKLYLPWNKLAENCFYYMFHGCTDLIAAPQLSATALAEQCYRYMFSGCSNLINAPSILPATVAKSYCYFGMFSGCSNLINAPQICLSYMNLTNTPCKSMFGSCSNLNKIKVHHNIWQTVDGSTTKNYFQFWVSGVGDNGTFYCPANLPIEYGTSRIPQGWSVINI